MLGHGDGVWLNVDMGELLIDTLDQSTVQRGIGRLLGDLTLLDVILGAPEPAA